MAKAPVKMLYLSICLLCNLVLHISVIVEQLFRRLENIETKLNIIFNFQKYVYCRAPLQTNSSFHIFDFTFVSSVVDNQNLSLLQHVPIDFLIRY